MYQNFLPSHCEKGVILKSEEKVGSEWSSLGPWISINVKTKDIMALFVSLIDYIGMMRFPFLK